MKIRVLTLFPQLFEMYLEQTILKRANIDFDILNIRDFANNKHNSVDDSPYGGGGGMILKPEPFWSYFVGLRKQKIKKPYTIFVSPQGKKTTQKTIIDISKMEDICIISGRYEGLDQRVIDKFVDIELSTSDFVLSSGDLPALSLIDGIIRMKDGVIKEASYTTDSFYNGLLGYPQYTKPEIIDKMRVPEVLISGNHKKIEQYRNKKSLEKTILNRPDLYYKKFEDENIQEQVADIFENKA